MTDVADDLDADFGTRPRHEVIAERLVHGESRRAIARDLGITLEVVHTEVAQVVREWGGSAGTYRERVVLLHLQLDDILDRIHNELSGGRGYDLAPLLDVLLGIHRLRAALLAAEKPAPRSAS